MQFIIAGKLCVILFVGKINYHVRSVFGGCNLVTDVNFIARGFLCFIMDFYLRTIFVYQLFHLLYQLVAFARRNVF